MPPPPKPIPGPPLFPKFHILTINRQVPRYVLPTYFTLKVLFSIRKMAGNFSFRKPKLHVHDSFSNLQHRANISDTILYRWDGRCTQHAWTRHKLNTSKPVWKPKRAKPVGRLRRICLCNQKHKLIAELSKMYAKCKLQWEPQFQNSLSVAIQ
jgi:hypothetical protein